MDSKWSGRERKLNLSTYQNRSRYEESRNGYACFRGADLLRSLPLEVQSKYTIFKECHDIFEF